MFHAASEEAFAYGAEAQGDVADVEAVVGAIVFSVEQPCLGERLGGRFGGGDGGIDQGDVLRFFADQGLEQREVGAAEDECVDVVHQERFEVFAHGQAGYFVVEPAFFHQRHEQRRRLRAHERVGVLGVDGAGVGVAVDGGVGGDDADFVVARGIQCGLRAGGNHVQYGHIACFLTDFLSGNGGDGVARDDQCLNIVFQQEIDNLHGEGFDGGAGFGAVGNAGGVAEVDDVFHRQAFHQGADVGQSADAGIENADGALFADSHDAVCTD